MDTAHGRPHLDRVFLPRGTEIDRRTWLEATYTYERMKQYLLANWQRFVDAALRYGR